ncbi:MAG: chemoreceptor glutamine deamidase CheD [Rhodobacteraceae bacterium]|nr:chemoreceptor glutamine deamidase CheD [Paracoccaceae bacterium]
MTAATQHSAGPRTYFDAKVNSTATIVLPGDHLVTSEKELAIVTLLGSCVAACIRDVELGVGGLNHFLLPEEKGDNVANGSARYGTNAMEVLINDVIKLGGRKDRMEAKVFGGANVIDTNAAETVGDRNCQFVIDYLRRENISVAAKDLGGVQARRVFFFPATGRVSVLRLEPSAQRSIREQEAKLKQQVNVTPTSGGVELFV